MGIRKGKTECERDERFFHECCSYHSTQLSEAKERMNLRCGGKWDDVGVRHSCMTRFVVLDFVFLLIEFSLPEKVVDGFIVL